MSSYTKASLFILLLAAAHTAALARDESDLDDLDLLELDLEDPDPSSSSLPLSSSVVSLAQQKKALIQLSDHTAPSFLASNQHVLLLGYAPWCMRSSELMPEFAAAALLLQEAGVPVSFAKLDGVANQRIASLYSIKGFPTLLFFVNGLEKRYTGGFTRNEIVIWVKKHTGTPATTVISKVDAEEILKRDRTTVVGFFEQFVGSDYEAFISVAMEEDETEFAQVDDANLAKLLSRGVQKSPPFLSIIKSEPETYTDFEGTFDKSNISWFVEVNKRPLVTKVDHHNYMKLYASPIKLQVTLFADAQSSKNLLPVFQEVAKSFKGQILFLLVDTVDEELSRPTLMLYGADADEPVVTAFNYGDGSKFLLEESLTLESLKEFCSQLVTGARHPYYKSQPIPLEEKDGVQTVVGKNFESVVFDDSKDVFLEVYTDWCTRCGAANKAVDALGKHFKDVSSLVIAKIDAAANEHPLLQVEDYPSFLFYPTHNKTNPIAGPKQWSTKKLVQFVRLHATVPLSTSNNDEL